MPTQSASAAATLNNKSKQRTRIVYNAAASQREPTARLQALRAQASKVAEASSTSLSSIDSSTPSNDSPEQRLADEQTPLQTTNRRPSRTHHASIHVSVTSSSPNDLDTPVEHYNNSSSMSRNNRRFNAIRNRLIALLRCSNIHNGNNLCTRLSLYCLALWMTCILLLLLFMTMHDTMHRLRFMQQRWNHNSNENRELQMWSATMFHQQQQQSCNASASASLRLLTNDEYIQQLIAQRGSAPPRALPQYYVEAFPLHLTYRPRVNCTHGRYLSARRMFLDGFGSVLIAHNAWLDLALQLGMQQLSHPYATEHTMHADDTDTARNSGVFRTTEWQVSEAELLAACPEDSPVRRNVLQLRGQLQSTCTQCEPRPDLGDPRRHGSQVAEFAQQIANYTLELTHPETEGFIAEIESFAFEPLAMTRPSALITQLRQWGLNAPTMRTRIYPQDATTLVTDLHVAVHVRLGDIVQQGDEYLKQWQFKLYHPLALRSLLTQLLDATPAQVLSRLFVTLYSEGTPANLTQLTELLAERQIRHRLHLQGPGSIAMQLMRESDLVLMAKSAFSWSQVVLNSHSLKLLDQDALEFGHFSDAPNLHQVLRHLHADSEQQTLLIIDRERLTRDIQRLADEKDQLTLQQRELLFLSDVGVGLP